MQPDVEALTCDYLRGVPAVAAIVDDRVFTMLPAETPWPAVNLFRIGGGPDDYPYRLDHPRLQIDSWADTKAEAHDLARTVEEALWIMPKATHDLGVVTAVRPDGPFLWMPDDSYPTPLPRYLFGVTVTVHPH